MEHYKTQQKGFSITATLLSVAGGTSMLLASAVGYIFISKTDALSVTSDENTKDIRNIQIVDSNQDTEIALMKQSLCIQNQNQIALGKALKVTTIVDNNCK